MSLLDVIKQSVGAPLPDGQPSPNLPDDVRVIQNLLNNVPAAEGGPPDLLVQDGVPGPDTIKAIHIYQIAFQGWADRRVDPGFATCASLSTRPHPHFKGISDPEEKRAIILRRNPEWNFSRGDFSSLTSSGKTLTFDAFTSAWLNAGIQDQLMSIFVTLLDPGSSPSATWGIGPEDWYHSHLSMWSRVAFSPVSPAATAWAARAHAVSASIDLARSPFLDSPGNGDLTDISCHLWQPILLQRLQQSDVVSLQDDFLGFAESFVVHHTFEGGPSGRPAGMSSEDPRRHWMTRPGGSITTSPYRTAQEIKDAKLRSEFLCEGYADLYFVISQDGVISVTMGDKRDLAVFIGLGSNKF